MDDPIKVIWKYKNNNRRVQYHQYIFLGGIGKNVMKILNKITDLNFYDTLITISKDEYQTLEKIYGDRWYEKIFNSYHLNSSIATIKDSSSQKKELTELYGKEWFDKHIATKKLVERKLIYSYEAFIKDEFTRKTQKKSRTIAVEEDDNEDYRLNKNIDIKKLFEAKVNKLNRNVTIESTTESTTESNKDSTTDYWMTEISKTSNINDENSESDDILVGGNDEDNIELEDITSMKNDEDDELHDDYDLDNINNDEEDVGETEKTDEEYFEEGLNSDEVLQEETEDLDEIEKMYQEIDVEPDQDVSKTSNLIKQALADEKIFDKRIHQMTDFDKSKDMNIYDENLKDVYKKIYVTHQYIFKDDTIKVVKDKICCSLKNNDKFGKHSYLIPSRQYLWCEYYFDDKLEKVMLGQKWMRRNQLLAVDVEPNNNLRHYEELTGALKLLRDNMKRDGSRLRREDDETNIIYDYENYMMNNEIYMCDVYNELGLNYKYDAESFKNLQDVYLKIYYPKIKQDNLKGVIDYLNGEDKTELTKINSVFETINNDLIVENEIMDVVESVKIHDKYRFIFKDNFVTQSVIHCNLRLVESSKGNKIDLYRIFNEFTVNHTYPFIQYQTPDGNIVYKFNEVEISEYLKTSDNINILSKWFENAPYGISFKVRVNDKSGEKIMAMTLSETGRLDYKTQWKEEDMATINDISKTYVYAKSLIEVLNKDNNKAKFEIPDDSEFKYAFINTIQKFELPEKYTVNHNDLSDFSRCFYPYVALVIEPRKRKSKGEQNDEKSKFGTYLRYKRVSKYENQARIEQRIMYFIRNYEFTDNVLAAEISKQFNTTEERALAEIVKVKARYPNLKKLRKILKKLENIPKYKPPGIAIDIQGKQRENYKIRISGARSKNQLDRMIDFINILMFLYLETYLYKRPERQILKEKLKKLTKIAKRRSKVEEVVDHGKDGKTVKQMALLDKRRIGFKPDKGQNQWTRSCQNSGDDKKRRPQQYNTQTLDQLLKDGYALNKKTGAYEKKVMMKGKKEIVLKTIRVPEIDEEGNKTGNEIHYACDPKENGEHMYVGFLTKSRNPFGHCMPCCFKKDPMISKNKEKRQFFLNCLGSQEKIEDTDQMNKSIGDKLYILQDTNKIQEGRFGFLPKYLDFYFNTILGKEKKIKHHYLTKTTGGYFFKFGTKQDDYPFLNAISAILDIDVQTIKTKIIKALEDDKNEQLYTYLNNGDIKTQFGDKNNYISYIKYNTYLDFDIINAIMSIPDVLVKGGLNIVIFQKKTIVIRKTFEKEKIREDFNMICQNIEDVYSLTDPNRNAVFLIKENKNYYPIVLTIKEDENVKNVDIKKKFKYEEKNDNIVHHIKDFYEKNCNGSFTDSVVYRDSALTAKQTRILLTKIGKDDYKPKYQIIDVRNKCKYIITSNNTIVPVRPSGSLYDLQIVKGIDKYINTFKVTFDNLLKIYDLSKKSLSTKPYSVYYDDKNGDKLRIIAILTKTKDVIPVKQEEMSVKQIEEYGLTYENKPLTDKIDTELAKENKVQKVDDRLLHVRYDQYENESYELFRLEFSNYINRRENLNLRTKIENIMNDQKNGKKEKVDKLRLILYRLIDKQLFERYKSNIGEKSTSDVDIDTNDDSAIVTEDEEDNDDKHKKLATREDMDIMLDRDVQQGGKYDKLIHVASKIPYLMNYKIKNDRDTCNVNKVADTCNLNHHCKWTNTGCYMSITREMIIKFVNKLSEELSENNLKAFEVMRIGNYFVSDIVDINKFTERKNQKLIRSSSNNIKKALTELFGKDNIPKIGRRKGAFKTESTTIQINMDNPLIDMKDHYIQPVIDNNMSLLRAYVNGYYWVKKTYNDVDSKNLGYYSPLQTDLANYFRGAIIDWLKVPTNEDFIEKELVKYMNLKKSSKDHIHDFIVRLSKESPSMTNCIVELFILSKVNSIPIVIYDDNMNIIHVFDDGFGNIKDPKYSGKNRNNFINLKFHFITNHKIPDIVQVVYFKDD
uniref:Early transcription factor VETF large subunit n=1 Tax=viral metagenome TaxID=1070528 RepID=A0A6C0EAQ0_9ZZZZ